MYRLGSAKFEIIPCEESEFENPYLESFKQLYGGIHVRQGYQDMYTDSLSGRKIKCFDTIQGALNAAAEGGLIFIHANKYNNEVVVVDKCVEIIGELGKIIQNLSIGEVGRTLYKFFISL